MRGYLKEESYKDYRDEELVRIGGDAGLSAGQV